MKKILVTAALIGTALTAQAADLNSCSATYTVAAAAFGNVGENRNADAAAYYAGQTRVASTQRNWNGNQQLSSQMFKQALSVQQGRFRTQGWPALSSDLKQCEAVLKQYNIQ